MFEECARREHSKRDKDGIIMGRIANRILDNDSTFGKFTTRLGILIGANLMFSIVSIPVVTIGPALAALYYVVFRVYRTSDGVVNPFKEFWKGLKLSFKQGIIYWLILLGLIFLGWLDVRFCRHMGGILTYFQYAIYVLAFFAAVLTVHFFPVLAAFDDSMKGLIRNSVFFAGKNVIRSIILVAVYAVPLTITYLDRRMFPLYGFIWTVIGFAFVAMISARLLLKDFEKYLPPVPGADGEDISDDSIYYGNAADPEKKESGRELEDMKKLGM